MRIAQIAPLGEPVPPYTYGGTELVVSLLTDELVRRGHQVTLFATGDSQTLATLEPCSPKALRALGVSYQEAEVYQTLQLNRVFQKASEFDIIHSHVASAAFPYVNFVKTPLLHTVHGIIPPHTELLWRVMGQQNLISISHSQRRNDLGLNYIATVYNGINTRIFPFYANPNDPPYLAFLGRFSPEKGPHLAIEIAKKTGFTLKMAGKIDPVDRDFFEEDIKPLIDGEQIQFLGEANHQQKCQLLGGAIATLFPITWPEPFGLVMVESMVLGTPVIAIAKGSTKELIKDGETGFLCQDVAECVTAVSRLPEINRHLCREHIVNHFSVTRMVDHYEAIYQSLVNQEVNNPTAQSSPLIIQLDSKTA